MSRSLIYANRIPFLKSKNMDFPAFRTQEVGDIFFTNVLLVRPKNLSNSEKEKK